MTKHAAIRMAQRGIKLKDADLIAMIGTEVADGYLVRAKDYQLLETVLKGLLARFRRVVGKRLVVAHGKVATAYHPSDVHQRRLLRNVGQADL
jgi:hypothetical protein